MGLINDLFNIEKNDWSFVEIDLAEEIEPSKKYINVFLKSLQLEKSHRGLRKLYGTIHSYISLPHPSGKKAEFQVINTHEKLKNVDAKNLGNIITIDKRLLGPFPYLGGDLSIEVGLFAIPSADLVGPFISVLETLSKEAGVSFISSALPFVKPIREGIKLLIGASDKITLEIGFTRDFNRPKNGTYGIIKKKRAQIKDGKYFLGADNRILYNDNPLSESYFVIEVFSSNHNYEYKQNKELEENFDAIMKAINEDKKDDEVLEYFTVFKKSVITSSDLIETDQDRIIHEVKKILERTLGAVQQGQGMKQTLPKWKDIDIP